MISKEATIDILKEIAIQIQAKGEVYRALHYVISTLEEKKTCSNCRKNCNRSNGLYDIPPYCEYAGRNFTNDDFCSRWENCDD